MKKFIKFVDDVVNDSKMGPLARVMLLFIIPIAFFTPSFMDIFNVFSNEQVAIHLLSEFLVSLIFWFLVFLFIMIVIVGIGGCLFWVAKWVITGKTYDFEWDEWLDLTSHIIALPFLFIFCFLFCKSDAKTELFKSADNKAKDRLLEL